MATGIHTGSVYEDDRGYDENFPILDEVPTMGSWLVTKDHLMPQFYSLQR